MVRPCGLLNRQEEPVPLKSISVTLSICEFVAGVSATLNYENEEKVPLEAFFVFPMDEDSAVYSFEAMVDGKKIMAELQDKMKAHTNYENAISQGQQAFLLEEDKCSRDVFCCNVGNLRPGSKAALTLKYVQELPLEADGALRYVLPAILNPRYQLSGWPEDSCLKMKTPVVPLEDLPYTLSMVATISSQHGIQRIQCNCPLSPIEYLGDDKTSAQISLADGHKFDRDVELLIYYNEVHTPSVAVEMGKSTTDAVDCLMGEPSAMVSFYPDIPEAQPPITCGEFVFLMDRSGSMQGPMSKQDKSQLRIEAAKETLILVLKSLPVGCYFNVYGFGSCYEPFFHRSVKYTQRTMDEALRRVKLMQADLGGTEILTPLRNIYSGPSIPGHPLQLFVFTDGEVTDTFSVIKEVQINSLRHRCFSFGIGEGASTSLIKGIARVSGGMSEFITGKERMQSKALRALKRSLQPVVEDVSLSWDLPSGLSAKMLSPEQTVIFRGQRLIIYAQLTGMMPPAEATGEVCLKYTLQGKSFENKVTFCLQPKFDANLTIHRLAAKSFLQTKDMGFRETPAKDKKDVLKVSIDCGVISSHTAFIAVNKDLNEPVQGPLVRRDVPRPILLSATAVMSRYRGGAPAKASSSYRPPAPRLIRNTYYPSVPYQQNTYDPHKSTISKELYSLVFGDNHLVQLISLQKADGSWDLNEGLAMVLGVSLEEIRTALPIKNADSSGWATVLAVLWLHANGKEMKCEWELLERKAVSWIHMHAGSVMRVLMKAAINFLKSSEDPAIFAL
ncbi:von Willebrand factor A domain-containing protein 5A isoform X1 [Pteropus medius]|uniref:von Willebrand factor A domain-containing protein 5A isoform X1 n=1 Tax=Pteropus vampyrus TaxID=132908 RepID=UPI00196B65EE|nr:von Willebrand factor A domain-containing protein 5A isoform X1 [Pteropus giganteus]XP_039728847.1 von Willebrand factor A domain-containing protein 5A isoform X1 [Pteropus giganteus]